MQLATTSFQSAYEHLVWSQWKYLAGQFHTLKQATPPIPCRRGVYIVRAPSLLNRVLGSSNVVYIGQAGGGVRGGKQGLGPGNGGPGRLFNTRGSDKLVRDRIEALYPSELFVLECAYLDDGDAGQTERELLDAYVSDHGELPPANHN